jgi:RNA polymerase sigma factor (sigma-70 family)
MCVQPLSINLASTHQNSPNVMIKVLQLFTSEAQLVKGIRNGDAKAQRYLYDKYAARMLAVCTRYLPDRMEAEDVMIEGFMKIFEKIDQYKGEGSFEGWIRRLMTNEALMQVRTHRQSWISIDTDEAQHIPADIAWADENLNEKDLMNVIEQLPIGYRTVFNLYAIEGYSHAEIAVLLNISESTSKSQLHRARATLQTLITHKKTDVSYNS